MSIEIASLGGSCPVEGEGTIDGKPFYFRARGERWTIGIGGEPVGEPEWLHNQPYGDEAFAAGYMSEDEARGFIENAASLYRAQLLLIDDQAKLASSQN